MDIIIEQTKFHRILLKKFLIRPLDIKEIAIRNLLCYYQELICKKYPQEEQMLQFLEELYDAKFKVDILHYGTYSLFEYSLECVDPFYIEDQTYTLDVLIDAFDLLTIPYFKNGCAEPMAFKRALEIYQSDLYSYLDSFEMRAFDQAIKTYFKGTLREYSKLGSLSEIEKITPKDLYQYYLKIQKDETLTIMTGRGVQTKETIGHISFKKDFQFKKRNPVSQRIHEPFISKQCYLEVIYDPQIFADDPLYPSMLVLNYILGGSPFSKLFYEVREQEGLCYSISSSYLATSGILILSCSTEKNLVPKVLKSVEKVFKTLFNSISLKEIKESILSLKLEEEDYIETAVYSYLTDHFFLDYPSTVKEIESIKLVTLKSLQQAYEKMKCSLIYTFGGDENA